MQSKGFGGNTSRVTCLFDMLNQFAKGIWSPRLTKSIHFLDKAPRNLLGNIAIVVGGEVTTWTFFL